ncbi:MAG TPA: TenA family protein [Candidatus Limnocylindria bacterium]|nr:TenA family protein [Candidatus Limnocylindria bacterium]
MSGIAGTLWEDNGELAARALAHPFVRGIGSGSLPRARFAAYVAQDAFFLDAFARAYALGLAHAPDRDGVAAFARLLAGVTDELRLHATYAARWGIDLAEVRPLPATVAYTDFLLATAALRTVGETCAAMTPCMRLYAYLGQELGRTPRIGNPYAEWIATYASADFEALAAGLERLLDRYVTRIEDARAPYRRALELELGFFDAHVEERA